MGHPGILTNVEVANYWVIVSIAPYEICHLLNYIHYLLFLMWVYAYFVSKRRFSTFDQYCQLSQQKHYFLAHLTTPF